MSTRNTIIAALIPAIAAIVIALIQFHPWWGNPTPKEFHIAGTVVDSENNKPIPQALVSVSGRTESYVTEDNGNFRMNFKLNASEISNLRIRVTKGGYQPYDSSVTPPIDDLIIQLQRQK